jgi:hypothetical protein
VTILTVGFGDLYPTSDLGRGIVFPYSVGGIIMLGLVRTFLHIPAHKLHPNLNPGNLLYLQVHATNR